MDQLHPIARCLGKSVGFALGISLCWLPAAYSQLLDPIAAERQRLIDLPQGNGTDDSVMVEAAGDNPSPRSFTVPSLWWQQLQLSEQKDYRRLIQDWQAYYDEETNIAYVDVSVNIQIWELLDYFDQYAFVRQFGVGAKAYGYQTRIFSGASLVGVHVCDFNAILDVDISVAHNSEIPTEIQDDISCRVY